MFNMFIMKWDLFDAYCSWLFPVLEELDSVIRPDGLTTFQQRYIGRVSELLLDVWLEKNAVLYREIPYIQFGETNWPKKILAFIGAKFLHQKYKQSF